MSKIWNYDMKQHHGISVYGWPSRGISVTHLCWLLFAINARVDNRKKLVKQQHPHMSPQYGELWPTNCWERLAGLGAPQQILTDFSSWIRHCTDLAERRSTSQPNFAQCLAVSWADTLYIHFRGGKIHFASKSCVLLYWQCYCTAREQRASAKLCGVQ